MSPLSTLANTIWWTLSLRSWLAFRRALADPERAQREVMRRVLRAAAPSAFGREHGLQANADYAAFAARVPLRTYDEFVPWIDRIRAGEPNVLTAQPVRCLAPTSGSTAARKLIPYTVGLQDEFNRAIGPWIVDLYGRHPSLFLGPAYWSISPAMPQGRETSAVPIGFQDDSEYLGGIRKRLVAAAMAVPSSVRLAATFESWREQTLAHLRSSDDLRLLSIWHPTFFTRLLDADPTAGALPLSKLAVISCWADAAAAPSVESLASRYPHAVVQPKGLIATEGIVSIPFGRGWPLAVRSHFFEFLDAAGVPRLAQELRPGDYYDVALSTSGGLLRYRLHDQVRVDGHVGRTPTIRFVGKSGNISDLVGEKLSDAFVSACIDKLQSELGLRLDFAMLAPDGHAYTLYASGGIDASAAAVMDGLLQRNPHFDYCRRLGQLGATRVFHVRHRATDVYLDRYQARGQRLGDIKPAALSRLSNWSDSFAGNYLSTDL